MPPYINLPTVSGLDTIRGGTSGMGGAGPGFNPLQAALPFAALAGPWGVGASVLASILGGLFNRQTDPLAAYRRTSDMTYGAETPTGFASGAFNDWLGSPAWSAMQRSLIGQSQAFGNQLQGSLANRGLLNSGLGNIAGALGQNLYGGNASQAQGQAYQNFLGIAPEFFRLRQSLAGLGTRPTGMQAFGAGLQGLGNFGLNWQLLNQMGGRA